MSRFTSQKGRIQYVAPTARAFFPNSSFFLFSCQTQVMINLAKKWEKKKTGILGQMSKPSGLLKRTITHFESVPRNNNNNKPQPARLCVSRKSGSGCVGVCVCVWGTCSMVAVCGGGGVEVTDVQAESLTPPSGGSSRRPGRLRPLSFIFEGLQSDTTTPVFFFLFVARRVYASYIHLAVPSGRGGNTEEPPSKQDPRSDYFFSATPPLLYFPFFLLSLSLSLLMFFFTPIFLSTSHQTPPPHPLPCTRLWPSSSGSLGKADCGIPGKPLRVPGREGRWWRGRKASSSAYLLHSRHFSS